MQAIEQQQGRIRIRHWGERTIDLDLQLYGNQIIDTGTLSVPHPAMQSRDFLLYPLTEITPDLILPDGKDLQTLLRSIAAINLVNISNIHS